MANILDDTRSLRGGPPRALNIFTQIKILFGGDFAMVGSILFWFIMMFILVFVCQSELIHVFSFDGEWLETSGVIEETILTESKVNGEDLYRYEFSYNVDNQDLLGSSYGESEPGLDIGGMVNIEYRSGNPQRSRIVGMTTEMFSSWVGFILIFFLIGSYIMFAAFHFNYKALELIKNGCFTSGKLLSKSKTSTKINDKTVIAYEFEFQAKNRPFIAKCKTTQYHLVEDDELEKIIYNENDPNKNIVYDAFPHAPEIDDFGQVSQSGLEAIFCAWPTMLGITINILIYVFVL